MSLEEWKKEYYPIEAGKCKKEDALEHSLRKWIGLRGNNLSKYGLIKYKNRNLTREIEDVGSRFRIDSSSCALCEWYYFKTNSWGCEECPLYMIRGEIKCDDEWENEKHSPWDDFISKDNPEPMIKWLKKAKKEDGKADSN